MVIHLQRCQRERIAHVRKLQQHKYPLPLQQNSNWLSNCATALVEQLCNCFCTQIYHFKSLCTAQRMRALRAPSESYLPSLVCISEMEIACRARTVQSSNMLLLPPNCNSHGASSFTLALLFAPRKRKFGQKLFSIQFHSRPEAHWRRVATD